MTSGSRGTSTTNGVVHGALARLAGRADLNAFLHHVLAAAAEQLSATSNALFAFDESTRTFQLRAFALAADTVAPTANARRFDTGPLSSDETIHWSAPFEFVDGARSPHWPPGIGLLDSDPATWPRTAQFHSVPGDGSVLSVPVMLGHRPLGFTVTRFAHQAAPSAEQVEVAEALATQAGLALELLHLAETVSSDAVARERERAARNRRVELDRTSNALQTTTDTLTGATDLADIVPMVLRVISQTFASRTAGFFECADGDHLALRYCLIDDRVLTAEELLASNVENPNMHQRCASRFSAVRAHPGIRDVVVTHGAGAVQSTPDAGAGDDCCEVELNVPLVVTGEAVGVLVVYRDADSSFTDAEMALAEALAKLLSLAVEGARLAAIARDRAVGSAVAREQERAAVERVTALARANEALRRGTARIAMQRGETTTALDGFLLEALAATDACAGAVMRRAGATGTEFFPHVLAYDGALAPDFVTEASSAAFRDVTRCDPAGVMNRTIEDQAFICPIEDMIGWFPECYVRLRDGGCRTMGHFPIRVCGVVTGYLALVWREQGAPDAAVFETAVALALQASLALETQRLADEARTAAVAAERHAASIAVTEERTRLAREMHDTLTQGLAGAVMQLAAARTRLGAAYANAASHLDLADTLVRDTLAVARRAIMVLRPDAPDAEGLDVGLGKLVAELGPQCDNCLHLLVTGTPQRALPEVEFALLKIAQAAITNAVQHAAAGHILIALDYAAPASLNRGASLVRLAVTDDGIGFDPTMLSPGHFGLVGMRERAVRVGAALTLVTALGEGTEVVLAWPGPTAGIGEGT